MKGRRVDLTSPHLFEPGDYGRWGEHGWYAETPNGHGANLNGHQIIEHDDGTITVSPSIMVTTTRPNEAGEMKPVEVYHGFLARGIWHNA